MMVLLVIMDGWGLRQATPDNAVAAAHTPVYDELLMSSPFAVLEGSGPAVGLPEGQMGNSEVGHLNLGGGRIVYQDITRIDKAIETGEFFSNDVLSAAMERAAEEGRAVHLFGLVSDGNVHSSLNHLYALVELARQKNVSDVFLHAFTDGRDTPPTSGQFHMAEVLRKFGEIGLGKVATIGGRYYGMDRDRRWDRTDRAYRAIVYGQGEKFEDPVEAIRASYAKQVTDEFIVPLVIDHGNPEVGRLNDRDVAIMFNFRADRMRQLAYFLCGHEIKGYIHYRIPDAELITMTNFDKRMYEAKVAFHSMALSSILGEVLSNRGLRQLRTAETEKYAHITFFFNGGVEAPFKGEDRDMIASPMIPTYDMQPEMSLDEVTDNAIRRMSSNDYAFVLLNYANCDMVGHTGVFEAAKRAVEAVDAGVGRLLKEVKRQNGVAIITADHGNAEQMIDPETGGPWTAHTTNPVPCILYDPAGQLRKRFGPDPVRLREKGILADIAPTILDIVGIDIPTEMTGTSLIVRG
ncbi:MAG TPA: 2,3-bisphosphoglycerate-independent phosphoglycerate mutase [Acidobacteriota bacterium]|nr:2,3-bisphosphoglycerate-independent phosphoglycerate mutase [Acidobacteriota bacterium]